MTRTPKPAVRDMLPTASAFTMAVQSGNRTQVDQILATADVADLRNLTRCLGRYVNLGDLLKDAPAPLLIHQAASTAAQLVAPRFGVTVDDIRSTRRDRPVTDARQCVCYVARLQGMSLPEIGRYLNKDHTTVLHSVRAVGERPRLRKISLEVAAQLGWDRDNQKEEAAS